MRVERETAAPGRTETAAAFGVTVPLPLFNKGQTEVTRWRAEEEQALARRDILERMIAAQVTGAFEALQSRRNAIEQAITDI